MDEFGGVVALGVRPTCIVAATEPVGTLYYQMNAIQRQSQAFSTTTPGLRCSDSIVRDKFVASDGVAMLNSLTLHSG
jgi:hypothetical protein